MYSWSTLVKTSNGKYCSMMRYSSAQIQFWNIQFIVWFLRYARSTRYGWGCEWIWFLLFLAHIRFFSLLLIFIFRLFVIQDYAVDVASVHTFMLCIVMSRSLSIEYNQKKLVRSSVFVASCLHFCRCFAHMNRRLVARFAHFPFSFVFFVASFSC